MVLNGINQIQLSRELGITEQSLSAKINSKNGAEFNQGEILKIKRMFNLSSKDIDEIFFDDLVS